LEGKVLQHSHLALLPDLTSQAPLLSGFQLVEEGRDFALAQISEDFKRWKVGQPFITDC
jgi:hypothetical protein